MHIRPETPGDHRSIALLHARAFESSAAEGLIVSLCHQRAEFDPALSLVAEVRSKVVGHALFSPQTVLFLGQPVETVLLSPLGVDPAYQGQGIGGALIAEGHRIARDKGYALSFLIGHPSYYPRFGYRQYIYGGSRVNLYVGGLIEPALEIRKPTDEDLPTLRDLWLYEEGNVDFAIDPGNSLLDWLSPNAAAEARVYLRDGDIVGYTRGNAEHVRHFYAGDHAAARAMARQIGGARAQISLPLHPYSASVGAFGTPEHKAWDAAMALPFRESAYDEYERQLREGVRLAGRPLWPVAFDVV